MIGIKHDKDEWDERTGMNQGWDERKERMIRMSGMG